MLKILKPLEVRAGHAATIHQQVGAADDSSLSKDLLSGEGSGAVGALEDSLALNFGGVHSVERLLDSGGDKVIALFLEEELWALENGLGSAGEAVKGAFFLHPGVDGLDVKTIRVVNGRVVLDNRGNDATVFLKEMGGPVADSAEALDGEGSSLDTLGKINLLEESLVAGHLTDGIVDTETSGLTAAIDATLSDELTSAAALSVDVLLTLDVHVGILNPGHDLLVGAHVRSKTIYGSTDKALLNELHGVLAGHALELTLGEFTGVDLDATLAATEWNIGNCEFEGHEGRKSLNFLKINVVRVTRTTLAWELVGRVLGSRKD